MKQFEDTLQVCTLHRVLQTLDEPCPHCLDEIRKAKKHVDAIKGLAAALERNASVAVS